MKRFFTTLSIVLLFALPAFSQAHGPVLQSACSSIGEDFKTDPVPKGFTLANLSWGGHQTSGQDLYTRAALPNTPYVIQTPETNIKTPGSIRMGFKIRTSPGSNDYFKVGGFNLSLSIIHINGTTLASYTSFVNAPGTYCYQLISSALTDNAPVYYVYSFTSTAEINGTRIVELDDIAFAGNDNIILPVNFSNITGRSLASGNIITWNVSEENNVSHYEVEKSTNGSNYTKIAEVPATSATSYSYTDITAPSANDFYRVRSKDLDGASKLSPVLSLKSGKTGKISLKAFPSPARTTLTIQHDGSQQGMINISSVDGRLIKSITASKGTVQTMIDVSGMQPGMYILNYKGQDGEMETMKFIRQ
jgi:hypothetical protein